MRGNLPVVVWLPLLAMAVASTSLAAYGPPDDDVIRLVRNDPPADLQAESLETGPIVAIQSGTPLVAPGTFCVGDWMGPRMMRVAHTFAGGETYYSLQDPAGALAYSWGVACSPSFTFDVTAINMEVSKRPTSEQPNPFTFNLQPVVFDANLPNPGCPVPGGVKCAGPVYMIILTGGSTAGVTFKVNLPFTFECCVTGPYFAAVHLAGTWAAGIAQVTTDGAGSTPPPPPLQPCHSYLHDGSGLFDWVTELFGAYHLRLYSEGYTPNDPMTHCTAGICDWQWWYGVGRDAAPVTDPDLFAYTIPNASGARQKIAVRFTSLGLDTLKQVAFMGWSYVGTPDILVEVFGPTSGSSCGMLTQPGPLLYSVTVPNADLVTPPLTNHVSIPDITWGMLNGGFPKDIFVSLSVVGGLPNRYALYFRTKAQWTCTEDPHTMFNVSGGWFYGGDYFGDDDEAYIDAYICKELIVDIPPSCASPGPGDWNTWMHDYRRTGASSMDLGDPCSIRSQWSKFLPHYSNFTEPVVAGGKVYVSSDQELNAFDLASGSLIGTVSNEWERDNRCNVSVEGNRVFLTSGRGGIISCWDTTLTTVFWSQYLLSLYTRFRMTAVYPIGSDTIVIVGTNEDSYYSHGWLYALDVKTGLLYPGWATNPVALDKGAIHAPAFDGASLFVGTSNIATSGIGSLYSINAMTGTINWRFSDATSPNVGWPGGVSAEGDYLYGATNGGSSGLGQRYKIDKSGTSPVVVWRYSEGSTSYAAPTIGPNLLYIPQDLPSSGVLMVDKLNGMAVYNFANNGVGSVPQPVTLTCDKYLFAGDRLGYWHLLNTTEKSIEWRREFTGIVNGTALAHHAITGDDYAIVNARSSVTGHGGTGVLTAWRFHQPDRPFLHQYVYSTDIQVPLNSGSGGFHTEPGVYGNDGCRDLNITATNLHDHSANASVNSYSTLHAEYAATLAKFKIGSDYISYFDGTPKQWRRARLALVDGELNSYDLAIEKASEAFQASQHAARNMAASAGVLRTSNVTYSRNPISEGGITNVSWNYDGTGLGRGTDDESIEPVNNDPDFYPEDLTYANMGYPRLVVHYVGGCPEQNTTLMWNTLGAVNSEKVWNHGALGDAAPGTLVWGADGWYDESIYDGGFLLAGDSSAALGGAHFRIDYSYLKRLFVPNLRPSDSTCGLDKVSNIHLGWRRQGGCPGQPVEILGSRVTGAFADTNTYYPPTDPLSSLGVNVIQTEVGANDPMYGDFKLICWKIENRDEVPKDLKAGSFIDWDVGPSYGTNVGLLSDNFNGYAQWDAVTPLYSYGMFDPNLPTAYCSLDPTANSPHKISSHEFGFCNPELCWPSGNFPNTWGLGWAMATRPPYREYYGPQGPSGYKADRGFFLVNKGFTLPANGSHTVVQALYAVPATSNDVATIDALGVALAKRAARWAGFARGDVNDDGCVNLADVCWLTSGNQIYPDTYCGDVNSDGVLNEADGTYLMNYVSGSGPAPQGAWRFIF